MFRFDELPPEKPAASFLAHNSAWVTNAACHGLTDLFYDDDPEALPAQQEICAACPVRAECASEVLDMEGGADESMRFGFRAYMTPAQRQSMWRRGGTLGRDPKDIVEGNDGGRPVPPVPLEGDQWSRRHTHLARQVVAHLNKHVVLGEPLPEVDVLAKILGCNATPLRRVLDGLVQDGTLNVNRFGYVMRGGARAVGWLPVHLRRTN